MARIKVIHPFSLRSGTGAPVREFPVGEHDITQEEFEHWFMQACLDPETGRAILLDGDNGENTENDAGRPDCQGILVSPTKEELMGLTAADLKVIAQDCGIAYPERATKSQLADLLLAGREGVMLRLTPDGIFVEKAD